MTATWIASVLHMRGVPAIHPWRPSGKRKPILKVVTPLVLAYSWQLFLMTFFGLWTLNCCEVLLSAPKHIRRVFLWHKAAQGSMKDIRTSECLVQKSFFKIGHRLLTSPRQSESFSHYMCSLYLVLSKGFNEQKSRFNEGLNQRPSLLNS